MAHKQLQKLTQDIMTRNDTYAFAPVYHTPSLLLTREVLYSQGGLYGVSLPVRSRDCILLMGTCRLEGTK